MIRSPPYSVPQVATPTSWHSSRICLQHLPRVPVLLVSNLRIALSRKVRPTTVRCSPVYYRDLRTKYHSGLTTNASPNSIAPKLNRSLSRYSQTISLAIYNCFTSIARSPLALRHHTVLLALGMFPGSIAPSLGLYKCFSQSIARCLYCSTLDHSIALTAVDTAYFLLPRPAAAAAAAAAVALAASAETAAVVARLLLLLLLRPGLLYAAWPIPVPASSSPSNEVAPLLQWHTGRIPKTLPRRLVPPHEDAVLPINCRELRTKVSPSPSHNRLFNLPLKYSQTQPVALYLQFSSSKCQHSLSTRSALANSTVACASFGGGPDIGCT